jgi:DNA-binding NarL/FixJ family response regulator
MAASRTIRTLLVEDDAPIRILLRRAFERSGQFEVVGEAPDGAQAVEQAKLLQPDLVMLDLMMPIMNGFQALPLLRAAAPEARVIVLSMLQGNPIQRECIQLGASLFIDKMVKDDDMIRQVLAVMDPAKPSTPPTVNTPSF